MRFFTERFARRQGTIANHAVAAADGASEAVTLLNISRQRDQVSLTLPPVDKLRTLRETLYCGQQMLSLLDDPNLRVLRVDLRSVKWVSSELLAQFARVHYRASQQGKHVILENANEAVQEVFHVTRFDRLFELNVAKDSRDSWNQPANAESFA